MLFNRYDCHKRIDELNIWHLYIAASNLERTGWVLRGIENPETVAQHQMDSALMVVSFFRKQVEFLWLNHSKIQDTLLIHDIAEPDSRVWDITPHCNVSPEEKRRREEEVINEYLWNNPYALKLWTDYEYWITPEWRFAKEIDKLQAILKARFYEDTQWKNWITEEFYRHSVLKKGQISTPFLVQIALEAYESKPR